MRMSKSIFARTLMYIDKVRYLSITSAIYVYHLKYAKIHNILLQIGTQMHYKCVPICHNLLNAIELQMRSNLA